MQHLYTLGGGEVGVYASLAEQTDERADINKLHNCLHINEDELSCQMSF